MMPGRDREPHVPLEGMPHGRMPLPPHELSPYARGGVGPMPHPALFKEMRDPPYGIGPGKMPPHSAVLEEQLAAQHDEIQGLLVDNQRLAATHVALRQDLEAVQFELHRTQKYAGAFHAEKDLEMRELIEKSKKVEMDLWGVDAMRNELRHVNADVKQLNVLKIELTAQSVAMSEDLSRMKADLQQIPAIRAEIEGLKQELQRARAAIEYEKKGHAEHYEHGQLMEKKLVLMAREMEKLRAELANAEKARAVAFGNQGPSYSVGYGNPEAVYGGNPEAVYGGNPYPATNYGSNLVNPTNQTHPMQAGGGGYPQYGPGHGHGTWGAYDPQQAPGPR